MNMVYQSTVVGGNWGLSWLGCQILWAGSEVRTCFCGNSASVKYLFCWLWYLKQPGWQEELVCVCAYGRTLFTLVIVLFPCWFAYRQSHSLSFFVLSCYWFIFFKVKLYNKNYNFFYTFWFLVQNSTKCWDGWLPVCCYTVARVF